MVNTGIFYFFRLVRWKNLLIAGFIQLFMRYGFTIPVGMTPALDDVQFAFGVFATVLIMAAGYVVNDLLDIEADKINKPEKMIVGIKISENTAWKMYYVFNAVGLMISLILCLVIQRIKYISIPLITIILLYIYATDFKRKPLIGNLIISLLASLSILTVLFFDIMPVISSSVTSIELRYFVLLAYIFIAVFAFLTTLVRELLKTLEDIAGDQAAGYRTTPVFLGEKKTVHLTLILVIFLILFTVYSSVQINKLPLYLYTIMFLQIPWILVVYFLLLNNKKRYSKAQKWMKFTMITGILSLVFLL